MTTGEVTRDETTSGGQSSWALAARICFGVTAVLAATGVGMQLYQASTGAWLPLDATPVPTGIEVWHFLSYFTTQSNVLVLATALTLIVRPDRDGPVWRVVRLNALAGITITGLVHWFLLRPPVAPVGVLWLSDALVHVFVPLFAVVGWLIFGPRPRLSLRVILRALLYPLAWLGYTLIIGAVTHWYPYFFLDTREVMVSGVVAYSVGVMILLLVVSAIFRLSEGLLCRREPGPHGPAARLADQAE